MEVSDERDEAFALVCGGDSGQAYAGRRARERRRRHAGADDAHLAEPVSGANVSATASLTATTRRHRRATSVEVIPSRAKSCLTQTSGMPVPVVASAEKAPP